MKIAFIIFVAILNLAVGFIAATLMGRGPLAKLNCRMLAKPSATNENRESVETVVNPAASKSTPVAAEAAPVATR